MCIFSLSYIPSTLNDQQNFINTLAVVLGNIVQYDKQYKVNTVADVCNNLTKNYNTTSSFDRFAAVMANGLQTGIFKQSSNRDPTSKYS